ncbi:hypothetical protein [Embleya sp. NPDC050493]|uniref:hypothetical protein n=1 Tax=Embleya sp. NPDC050493 TaxID=3363989 RepID=UPI0037B906E3
MTNSQRARWPEGVLARYLTVGGATVDLTTDDSGRTTAASCTGCLRRENVRWRDGRYDYSDRWVEAEPGEAEERAEKGARAWAQTHAESCRSMPKPAGDPR